MNLFEILLLGIALGCDCFVVSFAQGLIFHTSRIKNSLMLAFTMGIFQGLMAYFGDIGTNYLKSYFAPYSKIIAFTLFLILGIHFIINAFKSDNVEKLECISIKCLLLLGIATSIDALISGVSINLTNSSLILSCLSIGIISFIMSECGFWLTNFAKKISAKHLQTFGGLILIFLGIKILLF